MSGLLVDTQALLWFLDGDDRLSDRARVAMQDASNRLVVSAASVWELAIKSAKGKIDVPDDFLAALEEEQIEVLDVRYDHAWRVADLPAGRHQDPFDRMIVAQAQVEKLAIVTSDTALEQYDIDVVW